MKKSARGKTRIMLLGVVVAVCCLATSALDIQRVDPLTLMADLPQPPAAPEAAEVEAALKVEKLALSKKLAAAGSQKIDRNGKELGNSNGLPDVNVSNGISEKEYIVVF